MVTPKRVTIPERVEKVHGVVLCDRRVKVEEMAKIMGMFTKFVGLHFACRIRDV